MIYDKRAADGEADSSAFGTRPLVRAERAAAAADVAVKHSYFKMCIVKE